MIDRVQTARTNEHEGEPSNSSSSPSSGHCCTPAATSAPPAGRTTTASSRPVHPWPVPGAPLVDEFAPASFAAALGITLEAGQAAARRRPRARPTDSPACSTSSNAEPCRCGEPGRSPARPTTSRLEAVAFADRLICATPAKIGLVDAARLVQEARLYFDPDRAIADEEHELARRGVWLRHRGNPATTDVVMTLDTPDALLFDQTVGRIAGELGHLGDTDPRRRPAGTGGRDPRRPPVRPGPHVRPRRSPDRGCWCGEPLRPPRPRPARCRDHREARCRHHRPAARLAHPLRRSRRQGHRPTRPRPRPTRPRWTSTTHPPRCASSACSATPTASSPAAAETPGPATSTTSPPTSPSTDGGPPGQTNPLNLAPLCRTHHRMKTFTAWDYKRLDDGTYVWTSPTGHQYEVPPDQPPPTTKNLKPPPPRPAPAGDIGMPRADPVVSRRSLSARSSTTERPVDGPHPPTTQPPQPQRTTTTHPVNPESRPDRAVTAATPTSLRADDRPPVPRSDHADRGGRCDRRGRAPRRR